MTRRRRRHCKVYAFLMTLSHSRHCFLYPVLRETALFLHCGILVNSFGVMAEGVA